MFVMRLVAVILCAIPVYSQVPIEIPSRDTSTTFNSKVNLVTIPVVVRNSNGNAIGTLKKEDFQLFDKGKPQVISRFEIETADGQAAPLEAKAAGAKLEAAALETGAPKDSHQPARRFVAYLFDDINTPFEDIAQTRIAAAKHLAGSMQATDRVAIFRASGQTGIDFTDDREKLTDAMNRIMPRPPRIPPGAFCPDLPRMKRT
jgi:VWFA-related protein